MKKRRKGKNWLRRILMLILGALIFATTAEASVPLPANIRKVVIERFPGASILETRMEDQSAGVVYEVEIRTIDDEVYEVIVSKQGEILDIEEEKALPWIGGELDLGLGVLFEKDIYRGTDSEIRVVPFFRYENGPVEVMTSDALTLSYRVYGNGSFSVGVKGAVFFGEGYDPADSTFLQGMDELDTLYSAGLETEWYLGDWKLGLEIMQDISGEHAGRAVELSVGRTWVLGGFELTPEVGLTWMSRDMVDYFYGVSKREARSDRRPYTPGSSYEAECELTVQYPFWGRFRAVGIAGFSAYGSDIKDSPLVDRNLSAELILGIIYSF